MGEPQQIPVPPPKGNSNNCLIFGCIGVGLAMVVLVVGVIGAGIFGLRGFAAQYTEENPRQLPITSISEEDYAALSQRYDEFITAARANESVVISLSAEDINALIRNHPDFREARGHIFVTIENDVMGGEISYQFPDEFPWIGGRYLNGSATFQIEVLSGRPSLFFESIEVAGKVPPEEFTAQFRQQNLLQDAYQDPQAAQVLGRIESIRVVDGRLEIETK